MILVSFVIRRETKLDGWEDQLTSVSLSRNTSEWAVLKQTQYPIKFRRSSLKQSIAIACHMVLVLPLDVIDILVNDDFHM
jgi:hypothetical protein